MVRMTGGKTMRVGLDGFNLAIPRGTGIATYARALSLCLHEMGMHVDVLYGLNIASGEPPPISEALFFDRLSDNRVRPAPNIPSLRWWGEHRAAARGVSAWQIPIAGRVIADGFRDQLPYFDRVLNVRDLFPLATRHFNRTGAFLNVRLPDPPSIMHWTYPIPVRVVGAKNIYTVHDLVPLRLPHTTLDNKSAFNRLIETCIRVGDAICTVSETSLGDIISFYPQAAGKVVNTYQAVVPPPPVDLAPALLESRLRGLFGLQPEGYFLFFGSLEPKKNVGRLLEAYLTSGVRTPLVIVGAQAWKSEGELRLLAGQKSRLSGAGSIIQLDYLPFALLMLLIRGARAVTFPSLYEGFGLPVIEAMGLGVPVLTSRGGSLPEIAGEAAVLVDPYDTDAIATGLCRLDTDPALRARLRQDGPVQAARFSMDIYRGRIGALYASVQQRRLG